jgi:uncharacterized protein
MAGSSTATSTPDTAPYWEALTERSAPIAQHCTKCNRFQLYPSSICSHCQARTLEFAPVDGRGVVMSWTHVRRPPNADFRDEVPYVIALVRLDEGPIVMARTNEGIATDDVGRVTLSGTDHSSRPRLFFEADNTRESGS